jgi:excisionase family DNA binding protein
MPTVGTMSDLDVFTIAELTVRWRVSRQTIMETVHAGRLQAFRIGAGKRAHYRVPRAEVVRFESANANHNPEVVEAAVQADRSRRRAGGR